MPATTTYLKTLLMLTSLWVSANIAFNLVVDPFNAYHWVYREGFNAVKISANLYERIATPLILERVQPGRVFMGTSRSEIALDGASPALARQAPETTLNVSMSGASIYETLLLFQHAVQVAPVREAVIGLEIHAFAMHDEGRTELDAYVARDWQGRPGTGYRLRQFRDSLLALDVTTNSLETLEKQDDEYRLSADDGRFLGARTVEDALAKTTHREYFARWIGEWVKGTWTPCPSGEVIFRRGERFDSFARFRDILVLAAERGIDLKLYISPSHVLLMEAMRQSGVWPYSERWKTSLLAIADEVNKSYGSDFRIVDFELVNEATNEAIPVSQQDRMTWFFDPVHTTPAFGNVILDRLYQPGNDSNRGVTLRRDGLPQQLEHLDQQLERYKRDHPGEIAFVTEQVERSIALREGSAFCGKARGLH